MYRYRIPFVIGLKNNCPNCPNCPPEILVVRKSARYPRSVTALQFQIRSPTNGKKHSIIYVTNYILYIYI